MRPLSLLPWRQIRPRLRTPTFPINPHHPLLMSPASLPAYMVDIPKGLLIHTLRELDRNEAERLISSLDGTPLVRLADDRSGSGSYSTKISSDRANRKDNRWANVLAYDHSLLPGPYLNASLIPPYPCENCHPRRSYVASQAPLPHTLPTFYASLIELKVPLIVNLTAFADLGQIKSDEYWPLKKDQVWESTPGFKIEHREEPRTVGDYRSDLSEIILYRLRLYEDEEQKRQHDFDLLHITSWPDFGAFSSSVFTKLLNLIEETANGREGPLWIHCSAGIGRSGTVIATLLAKDLGSSLPSAMDLKPWTTPSLLAENALKAALKMVDHERKYRPKMIQTADQLGMVASVIGDLLQQ